MADATKLDKEVRCHTRLLRCPGMDRADGITARLAAGHNGMLTRSGLRAAGLTDNEITGQIGAGVLRRMHAGTYRHAAVDLDWLGRLRAAQLAAGQGAAVSHRSAGRLHGLEGVPRWRPELTVPTLDLPIVPGALVHRTNQLEPIDLTVVRGFAATALPRTFLDLGAILPVDQLGDVLEVAKIRRQVDLPSLYAVLERLGGPGRRGTKPLRQVLRRQLPDDRVESLLEHRTHVLVLDVCRSLGVEEPELQVEIVCADGRTVRFDFFWPRRHLVLEANGLRWHGTSRQKARDAARRASIEASGLAIHTVTWTDVHEDATATRARLCRVLVP